MATADLITQLKQDFDDVYAAGKAAGCGGGDYEQGYEDGKNSVVDYIKYAQAIKFKNLNLFGASEVNLNFEELSDLTEMFWANASDVQWVQNTTVEHITINTKAKVKNMYRLISNTNASAADTTLKHITLNFDLDIENNVSVNLNNAFQNAKGIEIIDGTPLNVSNTNTFNSTFTQCINLREIRFAVNSIKGSISFVNSSHLSTDTIQSIIDGLADLTDGTAQTLTLHATVGSKLTDEQKATITAKNWELVY